MVNEECVRAKREEIRMGGVKEDFEKHEGQAKRKAVFKFHTVKAGSHQRYLEGGRTMKR